MIKKKPTTTKKRKITKQIIENKVYNSIIGVCENLVNDGAYKGDGHLLAQKLSVQIAISLLPPQQKKIYDAMSEQALPVGQIAKKCKLDSKLVSAQLQQINLRTNLISFKQDKKNKLWHRIWEHQHPRNKTK